MKKKCFTAQKRVKIICIIKKEFLFLHPLRERRVVQFKQPNSLKQTSFKKVQKKFQKILVG
ncbi:hypothetical protein D0T49_01025 [Paludibacter sp. 221]|nr:hypothetical protein [Paludibacter sp. 221]